MGDCWRCHENYVRWSTRIQGYSCYRWDRCLAGLREESVYVY